MIKSEAALAYAAMGWQVLPVLPGSKAPASRHGVRDATADPEQISAWWRQNPEYNIGIAAGEASRLVVFDIDPRNGGLDSWADWLEAVGPLPDGAMAITAGGGWHYLAQWQEGIRSCKLRDGIDLLADGRYFVVWPSTIDGKSYEWEGSSDPFENTLPSVLPQQWLDALTETRRRQSSLPADGLLITGNRNAGLTAFGGFMRRYGATEAEIYAALSVANETRCEIPLPASELQQIAHSVARYDPEYEIAADNAAVEDSVQALVENAKSAEESNGYYMTRGTAYLSQPAPIRWAIRGWLPESGMAMVYGASGSGKTFITLDMACSIATGLPWQGSKVYPGVVVYLAGEGNYGIRQRVASWAIANGVESLDNLLISNRAIDINSRGSPAEIIRAVKEITGEKVSIVFVDTLTNHNSGDENKVQDTRQMLNSLSLVSLVLGASICLNHHVGVNSEAQDRARGSSAWRASMDSQIHVRRSKDGVIDITCTKMKDSVEPEGFAGRLESVPLGWLDDEGEPVSGAVFRRDDSLGQGDDESPKATKEEKQTAEMMQRFTALWWHSGAEELDGLPYISKENMLSALMEHDGLSERSARQTMKPGGGRFLSKLVEKQQIKTVSGNGWRCYPGVDADVMLLAKKQQAR